MEAFHLCLASPDIRDKDSDSRMKGKAVREVHESLSCIAGQSNDYYAGLSCIVGT
jgi:hypothetical protein